MAARHATSGPYEDTTPRRAACAILWLRLINWDYLRAPPPRWALVDPEAIGLSESTRIVFGGKEPSRVISLVNTLAEQQCWKRRDGKDLPVRVFNGISIGQVLDNFFDR